MNLKLKVCGMRDSANIQELAELGPDYMGFIFYDKSKRFIGEILNSETLKNLPKRIKKVGVFVDHDISQLEEIVLKYELDAVQLHGIESPQYCEQLKGFNIDIIKAFSIDENFDFSILNSYVGKVDFFLFDTKGQQHGGNGITFDWELLNNYILNIPYFLAGGIDLDQIEEIKKLTNQNLYSLDINSKFEIEPALKNISKIKQFKAQIDILNKVQ
jgi:phosphoribosylanthranilate isomerase